MLPSSLPAARSLTLDLNSLLEEMLSCISLCEIAYFSSATENVLRSNGVVGIGNCLRVLRSNPGGTCINQACRLPPRAVGTGSSDLTALNPGGGTKTLYSVSLRLEITLRTGDKRT